MRLEYYSLEKLKREIIAITSKHLDISKYKIFFFGSRVSGKGDEHSDIDIGINGPEEISYEVMARIKEEAENLPTLYKIEIVDFSKVSSDFSKVAIAHQEYF